MKRVIRKFYTNSKRKQADYYFNNILEADLSIIPKNTKAVYILVAKDKNFLYPNEEKSPVFYIGMSLNVKRRLGTHKKWSKKLQGKTHDERTEYWYKDMYQYSASFGSEVYIFTIRGKQTPKNLESEIMEYFYDEYLGKPVANGAFSFKKQK